MKVSNMTSPRSGRPVANQFILQGVPATQSFDGQHLPSGERFQSYDSVICHKTFRGDVFLDRTYWDYSVTTSRYRNQFLGETTAETRKKIASGEYKLADLN